MREEKVLVLALLLALGPVENTRPKNEENQQAHTSVNPVPPEDLVCDGNVEQTHSEREFRRRRRSTRWISGGDDRAEVKT